MFWQGDSIGLHDALEDPVEPGTPKVLLQKKTLQWFYINHQRAQTQTMLRWTSKLCNCADAHLLYLRAA